MKLLGERADWWVENARPFFLLGIFIRQHLQGNRESTYNTYLNMRYTFELHCVWFDQFGCCPCCVHICPAAVESSLSDDDQFRDGLDYCGDVQVQDMLTVSTHAFLSGMLLLL